jgi:3-phenylpropionate/trans-cinnamate dioxygenase ferredoxin reductase component
VDTRVVSIDSAARHVVLADAASLTYDHLVLATGARARRLDVPGAELDGVVMLRTAQDSARLAARLTPGARVVVLGGGFLGLEVAASAVQLKCAVTVVEAGPVLLGRILGGFMGDYLAHLHRARGVDIRTDARVKMIQGQGTAHAVELDDGTVLPADTVVVSIGAVANDELARAAGVECNDGVLVDAHARSSVPGIYAVGDVARQRERWALNSVRLESWENAELQAQTVARTILGVPEATDLAPWFWTDQYDENIQILGGRAPEDTLVMRGDMTDRSWCAFFVRDDAAGGARIHGALLMNAGRERRIVKQLMDNRQLVDITLLADTAHPLKNLPRT